MKTKMTTQETKLVNSIENFIKMFEKHYELSKYDKDSITLKDKGKFPRDVLSEQALQFTRLRMVKAGMALPSKPVCIAIVAAMTHSVVKYGRSACRVYGTLG